MGVAKTEWMEIQDRGWSVIEETYVCEECVNDNFLKQQIHTALESKRCDYCHRSAPDSIAAPVRIVQEAVGKTVSHFFAEPGESGCPYDEGFIINSTDTDDVLLSLGLNCHDDLFSDISDAFINDDWIPAANGHWSSLHLNETLRYSWDRFSRWVQHETRFFFTQISDSSNDYDPQEIKGRDVLLVIGELVMDLALFSTLPSEMRLYRGRKRTEESDWTPNADTLGAPPSQLARAGRMNPAGISYLYLAVDEQTAVQEIVGESPSTVVVAEFAAVRELTVLDLTRLPEKPSIFDTERRDQREGIIFLEHFAQAISQPVAKDGLEHVSYVPSQVVSEFFALVFRKEDGQALDGIQYPSSVRPGGKNLVLFPSQRGITRKFDMVTLKQWHTKPAPVSAE